jgi:hypothetical protein
MGADHMPPVFRDIGLGCLSFACSHRVGHDYLSDRRATNQNKKTIQSFFTLLFLDFLISGL